MIYVGFNHSQPKNKTCNQSATELTYRKNRAVGEYTNGNCFLRAYYLTMNALLVS